MSLLGTLAERVDRGMRTRPASESLWPGHWSQMLGHVILVAFVLLAVTGLYLAVAYDPGIDPVTYRGGAELYDGRELPRAFASVVRISEDLPGGLLVRRIHMAAAHLLIAVTVLHLLRVLYSGSFQGRRKVNHLVGVALLGMVLIAGWTGENLPFGLVAGTSLRVGYSILGSVPYVGEPLALLVYGGDFPTGAILRRSYWLHSLLLPSGFVAGVALHLWLYRRHTPTEVPGSGDEATVRGILLWPDLAGRLLVLSLATAGLVVASAAVVPWSGLELEGPYQLAQAGNSLQPPWFLFFPEGSMRLIPAIDVPLPGGARVGNVFVAAVAIPGLLALLVVLYPWIDPRLGGSRSERHILQHPFDVPGRAAMLTLLFTALGVLTLGATVDVVAKGLQVSVQSVINVLRVALVVAPVAAAGSVWVLARRRAEGAS